MLSLEDRSDPVALLGSLMNVEATNRLTVVFDGSDHAADHGTDPYVVGARAADEAGHPELRAELDRLVDLGYLAAELVDAPGQASDRTKSASWARLRHSTIGTTSP